LCGYPPFNASDEDRLYELIKQAHVKFEGEPWDKISSEAKNCIERMLRCDPAHRITAGEVLDHSWITGKSHDNSRPTNVLEMMRQFNDEEDDNDGLSVNSEIISNKSRDMSSALSDEVSENGTSLSQSKEKNGNPIVTKTTSSSKQTSNSVKTAINNKAKTTSVMGVGRGKRK
ncbi:hypothetical protein LOTGIDRAFT_154783, partial [Lottia gigantea]